VKLHVNAFEVEYGLFIGVPILNTQLQRRENTMQLDKQPDGEYFVDASTDVILPRSTWNNLSLNQLLEVQVKLQSRAWDFRNNEPLLKQLKSSLAELEAIIARRLSE
jgi:hypothetical protein